MKKDKNCENYIKTSLKIVTIYGISFVAYCLTRKKFRDILSHKHTRIYSGISDNQKVEGEVDMKYLTKEKFLLATEKCPVIPEIKNDEWLKSLSDSDSDMAYVLYGDICTIADIVAKVKTVGKIPIVHVDLIVGLSAKEISVDFIKKYTQADGIISMKPTLIKRANELGLFTIQRFYMIDGLTYANVAKNVKNSNPDVVEFMPVGLSKLIRYLVELIDKPIVASGLTQDREDVIHALKAGALAVATSNRELWNC